MFSYFRDRHVGLSDLEGVIWPPMFICPPICLDDPNMFGHPHMFGHEGLGGVRGFSGSGISAYKQVKFLGKILHHCCGNCFRDPSRSVQGGTLDNGL